MALKRCIFYGRALMVAHPQRGFDPPFVLFPQKGNQCALITSSHAPCRMEMEGEVPDQGVCVLVKQVCCEEIV